MSVVQRQFSGLSYACNAELTRLEKANRELIGGTTMTLAQATAAKLDISAHLERLETAFPQQLLAPEWPEVVEEESPRSRSSSQAPTRQASPIGMRSAGTGFEVKRQASPIGMRGSSAIRCESGLGFEVKLSPRLV